MSSKLKGKDLASFRQNFDKNVIMPAKIKAALAELGETWESEGEFVRRCGMSSTDFARYRDQFKDFYVDVRPPGKNATRAWAGTVAFTNKLRESLK
jgi:hypothetical protein